MENCDLIFIILCFFLPLFGFCLMRLVLFISSSIAEHIEYKRIVKYKYFDRVDELIKNVSDLELRVLALEKKNKKKN